MSSEPETFKGIILKSTEYKEKDRLISVLTKDRGIVNICVKGVAGKNSRFAFASLPYSYCDFVVTLTHDFYYLKEGIVISGNTGIMDSLESMAVAGHISDCLRESVMQSDNAPACYELAIYSYYVLSNTPSYYLQAMCIFNWRLMWILGLASKASECVNAAGDMKLSSRSCEILDFIGENPVNKIFTIKLEPSDIEELRRFTLRYVSVQFEKDIPDPILRLNLPVIRRKDAADET
ncbi:MAG: DNA repair protein RecO [Clostridiales bacterium]|nr:DNA repair protein RecO [Clostridiales bacterium]